MSSIRSLLDLVAAVASSSVASPPRRPFIAMFSAPVGYGKTVSVIQRLFVLRRGRCVLLSAPYIASLVEAWVAAASSTRRRGKTAYPPTVFIVGHNKFCLNEERREMMERGLPPKFVCRGCPFRRIESAARHFGVSVKRLREAVNNLVDRARKSIGVVAPEYVVRLLEEKGVRGLVPADSTLIVEGRRVRVCFDYVTRLVRLYSSALIMAPHAAVLEGPLLGRVAEAGKIGGGGSMWVIDEFDQLLFSPKPVFPRARECWSVLAAVGNDAPEDARRWIETMCRALEALEPHRVYERMRGCVLNVKASRLPPPPESVLGLVQDLVESGDITRAMWLSSMIGLWRRLREGIKVVVASTDPIKGLETASFDLALKRVFVDRPEVPRLLLSATPVSPWEVYTVAYDDGYQETLVSPHIVPVVRERVEDLGAMRDFAMSAPPLLVSTRPPTTYDELRMNVVLMGVAFALWLSGYVASVPNDLLDDFLAVADIYPLSPAVRKKVAAAKARGSDLLVGFMPRYALAPTKTSGLKEFFSVIDLTTSITEDELGNLYIVTKPESAIEFFKTVIEAIMTIVLKRGEEEKGILIGLGEREIRSGILRIGPPSLIVAPSAMVAVAIAAALFNLIGVFWLGKLGEDVEGSDVIGRGIVIGDKLIKPPFIKQALATSTGRPVELASYFGKELSVFVRDAMIRIARAIGYEKEVVDAIRSFEDVYRGALMSQDLGVMITYLRSSFTRGRDPPIDIKSVALVGCGYRVPIIAVKRINIEPDDTTAVFVPMQGAILKHLRLDLAEAACSVVQALGRAIRRGADVVLIPREAMKYLRFAPKWFLRRGHFRTYTTLPINHVLFRIVDQYIRDLQRRVELYAFGYSVSY